MNIAEKVVEASTAIDLCKKMEAHQDDMLEIVNFSENESAIMYRDGSIALLTVKDGNANARCLSAKLAILLIRHYEPFESFVAIEAKEKNDIQDTETTDDL